MAEISRKQWNRYITRLRQINNKAVEDVEAYLAKNGGFEALNRTDLIDYAYYVSNKYGEASAALSASMYDALAELSEVTVSPAVPAEITYQDVAKTVNGIIKKTGNGDILAQGIGRIVKMAGTDTILSNAYRDRPKGKGSKRRHTGAQVAWIPFGDTCPFCIMLASKGWMNQTEWGSKSHSEHIHANCDCTYAVRFNNYLRFEGYNPDEYKKIYENAEGSTRDEKFNSMRREYREENKDKINAQKRANYATNKIKVSQSAGDLVQPESIKGVFDDFKELELTKEVSDSLKELRELAQKDDNEHGLAFFEGGKTDIQTDNKHNSVIIRYPKGAKNVELLHCHTDESTLSATDLGGLVDPEVNQTSIITINGDAWSARVGNGIKPTQKEFDNAIDTCYDEAIRIVKEDPEYDKWSSEEKYYMLVREQMRGIGRYFEWDISGGKL